MAKERQELKEIGMIYRDYVKIMVIGGSSRRMTDKELRQTEKELGFKKGFLHGGIKKKKC